MSRLLWVAPLLLGACRTSTVAPPEAPPPPPSVGSLATLTEAESTEAPAGDPPALDPAPPVDIPLPRGVKVIVTTDGKGRAPFVWRGWFVGDAEDSRTSDRIARWSADGIERTPTEAAYELYFDDVRSAGHDTTSYQLSSGRTFGFPLTPDAPDLDAFVRLIEGGELNPDGPEQSVIEILILRRGG